MSRTTSTPARNEGGGEFDQALDMLPLFPLGLCTLLTSKKLRPFLAEMTGLSQSHLRRGKNPILRKTTEQRALESVKQWVKKNAAAQGWSETEIIAHMEAAPSSLAGEPRPYADFIHGLQIPGVYELPLTISFAEEVDKLVISLVAAHAAGDLQTFKQSILECNWADEVFAYVTNRQDAEQYESDFRAATDWGGVLNAVQLVFLNIVFSLFAALDAEYGLIYFKRLRPRPLFLLVAPKMNPKFDLHAPDKPQGRNLIYQPVRRLLELSHALMVWGRDQRWPDKPVGRKELGEALGLSDQYMGNFFDGTRKMNAKLFDGYWSKMCHTIAKCEPFSSPLPLFLAASYWQTWIARDPKQNIRSVILPDEANYTKFWKWHHRRWASQLNNGAVGWPTWLGDQPA